MTEETTQEVQETTEQVQEVVEQTQQPEKLADMVEEAKEHGGRRRVGGSGFGSQSVPRSL